MKLNAKIILIITTFLITSTQCSEVVIRLATEKDLDALNKLSHTAYQNDFKSLWQNNYSSLTPSHQTIDEFVTEKEQNNNKTNAHFIAQQKIDNNYCLHLAIIKNKDKTEHAAGFCRFEKKNIKNMYIHYILVDEQFRKQGIAKKLIETAFQVWDTVTICNFRALMHYTFINDLYKKCGCTQAGIISLDTNTGKIINDPNAPKTHYEYTYTIKK